MRSRAGHRGHGLRLCISSTSILPLMLGINGVNRRPGLQTRGFSINLFASV